jgi:hypothetical protein
MAGDIAFHEAALVDAHRHCGLNRDEIAASSLCGCFYCLKTYAPTEITEWIDDRIRGTEGRTALCPKCGIDSVIASASAYPITEAFLGAMRRRWFES